MHFKSKHLLTLLAACTITTSIAQKKQYTMAEAVNGLSGSLAPKGVKNGSWRPGTHEFTQVIKSGKQEYFIRTNFSSGISDTLMDMSRLRINGYIGELDKPLPNFRWYSNNVYGFADDTAFNIVSTEEKGEAGAFSQHKFAKGFANIRLAANGGMAYTQDNNLYFSKEVAGYYKNDVAVTSDINPAIVNGQAVHRDEFGIENGIFFSPRGNYLAYYRMDQTMVKDYPVIDWNVVPAKVTNVKYPMAGDSSHQVTLRVYNIATRQTVELKTGEPKDHYLTCVTWSPDEKYIYIAILNRGQNHLWLNQYDARTGEKIKTLLQEKSDKYVEPQHPLSFLPGSNTKFTWWSQRDGYMHLWLCDIEKNTINCLTPGEYVVNEIIGFNKRTGEVLITSAKEDPREKHGYAVSWTSGKMRRLDTEPGTHTYTACDNGEYLFDVFSDANEYQGILPDGKGFVANSNSHFSEDIPKRSLIRNVNGDVVKVLVNSPNPLDGYERPEIKDRCFLIDGVTALYGKLILPTNFDSTKKYPVIVYLYNGPHVQQVKNSFPASGNLWFEYLAQHGYIVWTMDGRGSSNRGLKFEQATFWHLGNVEMEDQLRGVEFLKSLPYVDSTRMGIHGWSFGGFMTTSIMLKHPNVFKVGVAGGPVMDWRMYEIMYGERYMDTPQENPEGYKEAALFDKVQNLKGKLLLIHGTQDATVVWQHSIKFLKAAVEKGVQVDYFVYPGYEHNVRGKDRVHLMQKITDYFDEYLKK